MNRFQLSDSISQRTFLGNTEAMDFMRLWSEYVHAVDDIEDESTTSEFRLRTFAMAIEVYTHPFFLRNLEALKQVAINATNAYADVVEGEKSEVKWAREFADVYRHFGQEMVFAVAGICARLRGLNAYDHIRTISAEWRANAYHQHHDKDGNAA